MPIGDTPAVYLTFDDGPHPIATPFVLDKLKKHNAKATFFCIGKNVVAEKDIYNRIITEGHAVGNHTQNHLNGWHTNKQVYLDNIEKCAEHIETKIFRPPYGRMTRGQINALVNTPAPWLIYMWDVLSADFDTNISPEECLSNVIDNIEAGSIVVFHDSQKAWDRMSYALPKVLEYCRSKNWDIKALPTQ